MWMDPTPQIEPCISNTKGQNTKGSFKISTYNSGLHRSTKIVSGLFIASLILWLLVVLALQLPSFPKYTPADTAGPHCRNGYYEEYRSTNSDGIGNDSNTQITSHDDELSNSRVFRGYGSAAHVFVEFGSYRGGNQTFTIVGLASKPLHVYGHSNFSCQWIPHSAAYSSQRTPIEGEVMIDYPDYGYGRAYTVVVITCTFDVGVGTDTKGGELILYAYHGDAMGRQERIVAMSEKPGAYNASLFDPPYPYDFLYCGSPLFGRLNARRVQEWFAYHDMVFGNRSHFVLYDAGGIHEAVREVLLPWIELGRVSIEDIRSTVNFDGHYYNQFLMVNDCLHRNKFLANWTFFFDLDEYIYVEPPNTLHSLLSERYRSDPDGGSVTQIIFTQYRMAKHLCHSAAAVGAPNRIQNTSKQWGFEKLTYRDLSSTNDDVKYVCNPRAAYSNGVHRVHHSRVGWGDHLNDNLVRYYHYHGTIDVEDESELCRDLSKDVDSAHNFTQGDSSVVQYDGTMVPFAFTSKKHETEVLKSAPRSSGT